MSTPKPYLVRVPEPGMAHVYDRVTGELVGYVLEDFHSNWEPMRDGEPCGPTVRYRADAVRAVWDTR